jgi:hypothetical protein
VIGTQRFEEVTFVDPSGRKQRFRDTQGHLRVVRVSPGSGAIDPVLDRLAQSSKVACRRTFEGAAQCVSDHRAKEGTADAIFHARVTLGGIPRIPGESGKSRLLVACYEHCRMVG